MRRLSAKAAKVLCWAWWTLFAMIWVLIVVVAAYIYPVEWTHFDPEPPVFMRAEEGMAPKVRYERKIIRPFIGSYGGTVRAVGLGGDIIFDFRSNPFLYSPTTNPVTGEAAAVVGVYDLCWWTGRDPECRELPPGSYTVHTCWEMRFAGGLLSFLPSRITCRDSNVLVVVPAE